MNAVSHHRPPAAFSQSAWFACAVLGGAMAVVGVLTALASQRYYGPSALPPAGIAWAICSIGAFSALGVVIATAGTPLAANAALAGMLFRMGIPLAGFVVVPQAFPEAAAHGFGAAMLANYFVALLVETLLAVNYLSGRPFAIGNNALHGTSGPKSEA